MKFDVVIPTRGELKTLTSLFTALNAQTLMPERVFLVFDKEMSDEQREQFGKEACGVASDEIAKRLMPVTSVTHDFQPGRGASYARNYGLDLVESPYLYFLDDDNVFDSDFFAKSLQEYQAHENHGTTLYSPTVGRRQTDHVQSVGIRQFHYRLGRPEPIMGGGKVKAFRAFLNLFRKTPQETDFHLPQMIGGNSLFGKTAHFRHLRFDERMPFVFEDLDMTNRRHRMIGPILVSKTNIIHHMERDKTSLERSFIATVDGAYQKSKNRIIFVKNNATRWQKIQFFGIGLWISTLRFSLFIVLVGRHKRNALKGLWKGVMDGLNA